VDRLFSELEARDAGDRIVRPWLKVYWRKGHPHGNYDNEADPTGGSHLRRPQHALLQRLREQQRLGHRRSRRNRRQLDLRHLRHASDGQPARRQLHGQVQLLRCVERLTTWANVGAAVNRYDGSTGWKQHTIDLTAYKGTTVQLGFVGISAYGNNEFIDDVTVTVP
jgi:hypothetical protein